MSPGHGHASLALDFREDVGQALAAVWRKLQGASDGVDDPSQDGLDRLHGPVSLFELFDRCDVLAMGGVKIIQGPEDTVN